MSSNIDGILNSSDYHPSNTNSMAENPGEIISADSRQVYRGLDIGTGKDLAEYGVIPYHLIDIASLPDEYSVFNYQKDF